MSSSSKSSGLRWLLIGLAVLVATIAGSTYYTLRKLPGMLSGEEGRSLHLGSGNIAVLTVEGVIDEKKATEVLEFLGELAENDDIKALVVRLNSPGGTVGASQEILEGLRRYARPRDEKKSTRPVVCSMGDITASGGVYIAMGCGVIFANPGTLTGSIGVVMQLMYAKDLYNWAKLEPVILKAGKFKDAGSESRRLSDEERALFQNMLDETHTQFRNAVLEGRPKLKKDDVWAFADGRIFTGEQAQRLGLVDKLGTEYDAIHEAAALANVAKPNVVRERFRKNRIQSFFDSESRAPVDSPKAFLDLLMGAATGVSPLRLQAGVPYYLADFALR